jgi:hypothetical protein
MSFAQPACLSTGSTLRADDLDAALVELGLDLGHVAELGGADRREVLGVREQHRPFVADPIVKADLAFGRLGREIRDRIVDRERHPYLLGCVGALLELERVVASTQVACLVRARNDGISPGAER